MQSVRPSRAHYSRSVLIGSGLAALLVVVILGRLSGGMLMAGVGGGHRYGQGPGGRREIPPFLAWAHAETYLPWANGLKRRTLEAVIDLVVDRTVVHPDFYVAVAVALADYAGRMRRRGAFERAE